MVSQIRQFLQDVFNDPLLMKTVENKAEEFTLNVFTVNDHARDLYLHPKKLHNDQANLIIDFVSRYPYLTHISYGVSGKFDSLTFYIYNKGSQNYHKFIRKSCVPFNETYIIEYQLEFNKQQAFLIDKFGSKDLNPDLRLVKQKMKNFTQQYALKPPLVILTKE